MTVGGIPLDRPRASPCASERLRRGRHRRRPPGRACQGGGRGAAGRLRVRFVETADPASPNGLSLLAAEPLARPTFFLQMVDHVFGERAPRLVASPLAAGEAGRVLVDRAPRDLDLDDATKVRRAGDRVTRHRQRHRAVGRHRRRLLCADPRRLRCAAPRARSEPRSVSVGDARSWSRAERSAPSRSETRSGSTPIRRPIVPWLNR